MYTVKFWGDQPLPTFQLLVAENLDEGVSAALEKVGRDGNNVLQIFKAKGQSAVQLVRISRAGKVLAEVEVATWAQGEADGDVVDALNALTDGDDAALEALVKGESLADL